MSELRALVAAAQSLRARGEPCFVATVVGVRGSSYRKPGARMVFSHERWLAGSVSGGCLERDVVAKGDYRTRSGPQVVTYDESSDEKIGTGCGGIVDVLVERSCGEALTDPLRLAEHCLAHETHAVLCTVVRTGRTDVAVGARFARLASGEQAMSGLDATLASALAAHAEVRLAHAQSEAPAPFTETLALHDVEVLVEHVVPPIALFVLGSAHDAAPLVSLGMTLGWQVTVYEPSAQLVTRERFRHADRHLVGPLEDCLTAVAGALRPAAVVMAHHYDRDRAALAGLLRGTVPYIGLLGARKRSRELLEDVAREGLAQDPAGRARVQAPVGLAIGAETPHEIALAIVAEIQAFFATRARPAP